MRDAKHAKTRKLGATPSAGNKEGSRGATPVRVRPLARKDARALSTSLRKHGNLAYTPEMPLTISRIKKPHVPQHACHTVTGANLTSHDGAHLIHTCIYLRPRSVVRSWPAT